MSSLTVYRHDGGRGNRYFWHGPPGQQRFEDSGSGRSGHQRGMLWHPFHRHHAPVFWTATPGGHRRGGDDDPGDGQRCRAITAGGVYEIFDSYRQGLYVCALVPLAVIFLLVPSGNPQEQ